MAWCICGAQALQAQALQAQALQRVCGKLIKRQNALPAKQHPHLLPHVQVLNGLVHK